MYCTINIVPVKKHNSISMECLESICDLFPRSTLRYITNSGKIETKSHESKPLHVILKIK